MIEFTHFIQTVGNTSLDYVWLPIIIWTIIALPIALFLHRSETIPPVYQYHSRIALILALPLGITGSYLTEIIGKAFSSAQSIPAKFIVIQSPITVSAGDSQATLWNWTDPIFWIGLAGFLLAIGACYYLLRIILNAVQLKNLGRHLSFTELRRIEQPDIQRVSQHHPNLNPLVAFSEQANIPFTYGWIKTKIVIPAEIKNDPEKTAMAIRHELMHIDHKDFLLNGILMVIKALFWFHPLTHYLYRSGQEFREITCDGQVLEDNQFSKKRYAALLFELAEREYRNSDLAMSMAVNPSSLKKRIQIMSTQNISAAAFRSSFLLTLATAALVVLMISCSDLNSEDGITNTELQQAQSQLGTQSEENQPLYFLNGEKLTSEEKIHKLSRLKSKYIKSMTVLKGEEAITKYGEEAKNGVISLYIWNETKEKAFTDLKEEAGTIKSYSQEDFFVAVEQMPELVGGLGELQSKINYPEMAKRAGIEGRVIVQFIVNEQGDVERPQIIRGIGGGCDKEALRVVKQAKFKPGRQRGQAVRVQYSLPIVYKLPSTISKVEPKVDLETPKVDGAEMKFEDFQVSDDGTLSGKVISTQEDTPLPGANIVIEGTNKGTSTNQDGEFSIQNLEKGTHILVISYVGYETTMTEVEIE